MKRSLYPVVAAGAALAGGAIRHSVRACDACEWRLIDESAQLPVRYSPDYAEEKPVEPSAPPRTVRGPITPAARQPGGVLSGRIVFMNGGHGWTWDPANWRLQRGVSNLVNEDMGNLDQMNLFAAWCFNAGAVVVPMRPLGQQTNEVVLDNDDPEVTWTGTWANSSSPVFYGSGGDIPYRYAALAAAESATATYTPDIPVDGYYPVYTWVRHGSDRTLQLYRIRHTGGETLVRIPHHMVGNGWVYLGEYYFASGVNAPAGSVVVSDERTVAAGTYAFADAIRFGNGMGTVDRGTGVSTYPREEENCRYWFQSELGQGQSSTLYDGTGADENDSWSAPPKMCAEMNREESGSQYKRIHISFHSNAGGGRGATALITSDPTHNQSRLAQLCGAEVNNDMVALGSPPLEVPWQTRSSTYSGGYSEIDGSLFNYEMDATIIEVAFHDSAQDAVLLRDPRARSAIAKATLHGVVKYMNEFDGGALVYPPEAPSGLRAQAGAGGSVVLSWSAPVATGGSSAPSGYVIYRSTNGYGFGSPVETGVTTSHTINGLSPGATYYFRVAAVNSGGESFPTGTAGCRLTLPGSGRQVLFVNAFDRFDRTLNLRQDLMRQTYVPPGASGAAERVLPRRSNADVYVVPHGRAISAAGYPFDSCQNEHAGSGAVNLSDYSVVIWACGQESTADETFSAAEQGKISAFQAAGGHLMVSGSEIAWDLARSSGPTSADRGFFAAQLKAAFPNDAADDSGSYALTPVAGSIFHGMAAMNFDDGTRGIYPVQSPDVITPLGTGVAAALNYAGNSGGSGAITYDGRAGGGRLVYMGVPFETVTGENTRASLMQRVLQFFDGSELLSPVGAVWKYRDTGSTPPNDWITSGFNDAGWLSGPARLGYGGDGEVTLLSNGGNPASVHPVTWLRRRFTVSPTAGFDALRLDLQRDDGLLVYLNGTEILRDNLRSGPLPANALAATAIVGAEEQAWRSIILPSTALLPGTNVLAVQLHQAALNSSDIGFDLQLTGLTRASMEFSDWQQVKFGSDASGGAAGELSDPDLDGYSNLMEYALGLEPGKVSARMWPAVFVETGRIKVEFPRHALAADVIIRLRAASALSGPWQDIAMSQNGQRTSPLLSGVLVDEALTGSVRRVVVTDALLPGGGQSARRFFRLSVTRQVP